MRVAVIGCSQRAKRDCRICPVDAQRPGIGAGVVRIVDRTHDDVIACIFRQCRSTVIGEVHVGKLDGAEEGFVQVDVQLV